MPLIDPYVIAAAIDVEVPAETAFEFMADGMKQRHWALGSTDRKALGDGVFSDTDALDGSDFYVKLESNRELLMVDFLLGDSPDTLRPHVEARIRPGSWIGLDGGDGSCVVTLTLWRWPEADQDDWESHWHVWHTEVRLIKAAIERGL
ncbi:MAG TPA: hypothetical protein VGH14_03820 [Solirubrobacterales bacterium]|jgi:hypothetical protein